MASRSTAELDSLPHAPGRLPILGDLTSVDRKRPTQHELHLSESLGPIFQRKLLRDRLVIVSGARLAAQTSDENHWGRALVGPGATLRRVVPDGLFTIRSSDPLWGHARRILTPGFTQAAMRTYHDAMQTVADDLTTEWSTGPATVDIHSAMTRATLEVIGRAGFSRDLDLFHEGPDSAESRRFVTALADVLQWSSETTNDLPLLGDLRNRLRAATVQRNVHTLRSYVDRVIAARTAAAADEARDLLSVMLTTTDPDTGHALPADNIASQVLTFLIAGHETTAALMEVALHYLAADPALQDDLRAEHHARGRFDYDAVAGMRLTRQVLNECLRLWPPLPGYFRVARTDQNLGGYRVPAGRAVLVLALAAHRDTDVWGDDADQFRPARFESEQLRQHPDRFFQPWGTGPRNCIGRAFALHEASLLLARILHAFTLTAPTTPLTMQERGTLRPDPYQLKVLPRT